MNHTFALLQQWQGTTKDTPLEEVVLPSKVCYYTFVMKKNVSSSSMKKIFEDPKLRGKHVIVIAGHIFTARTGKEAVKLFNKVTSRYPGKEPTVAYIPKADSLILIVCR